MEYGSIRLFFISTGNRIFYHNNYHSYNIKTMFTKNKRNLYILSAWLPSMPFTIRLTATDSIRVTHDTDTESAIKFAANAKKITHEFHNNYVIIVNI